MSTKQRWSRKDRCVHHPQHRAGEDEVRGSGGHLPDCQDAAHPEARHRSDRGELSRCCCSVSLLVHALSLSLSLSNIHLSIFQSFFFFLVTDFLFFFLHPGPVPVLLPGQSGVPGKL